MSTIASEIAWQRTIGYAAKLLESLDDLDESGGIDAALARMTPKARERAIVNLRAARAALDAALPVIRPAPAPSRMRRPSRGPISVPIRSEGRS